MKENMHYAENDDKMLNTWDLKELADWRVPVKIKAAKYSQVPDVEFTQVLDEEHNYVVLYFDNKVDWLQAQTILGLKPVRLLPTVEGRNNINGNKVGIGRVLRGVDVLNKLMKEKIEIKK
jgi:hypothetical protein